MKSTKAKVVKADYGDSGTNHAYSITGRKAGKRVVTARREKDVADKKPKVSGSRSPKPKGSSVPKPTQKGRPAKPKSPDAQLSLKPVKKIAPESRPPGLVSMYGEAQRREMARNRLKRQERQAAAAARAKAATRQKNAAQDRMGKVTTQRFKQSY